MEQIRIKPTGYWVSVRKTGLYMSAKLSACLPDNLKLCYVRITADAKGKPDKLNVFLVNDIEEIDTTIDSVFSIYLQEGRGNKCVNDVNLAEQITILLDTNERTFGNVANPAKYLAMYVASEKRIEINVKEEVV